MSADTSAQQRSSAPGRPAAAPAPATSPAPAFHPRIQVVNLPIALVILFGMWLCYEASSGRELPFPALLEPLKWLGLLFFRAEWMLRIVFWLAVAAHVWEGALGVKFALRVLDGFPHVSRLPFVAFWGVQTALVGYPSLRLIKAQRREQLLEKKAAGAASNTNKTHAAAARKAE